MRPVVRASPPDVAKAVETWARADRDWRLENAKIVRLVSASHKVPPWPRYARCEELLAENKRRVAEVRSFVKSLRLLELEAKLQAEASSPLRSRRDATEREMEAPGRDSSGHRGHL